MEQPTIFYAIALVLALMDFGGGFNLYLAWGYVILRIVHSIVHAIVNIVADMWGSMPGMGRTRTNAVTG